MSKSKHECIKCNNENRITITYIENGNIQSCNTLCETCGHIDYWVHGEYKSESIKKDSQFNFVKG